MMKNNEKKREYGARETIDHPAGGLRWPKYVLAALLGLGGALTSQGGTLFDYQLPITSFDNVLANPNDHLSWGGKVNITYSFDNNFMALFHNDPSHIIRSQIELALNTWAAASSTPYGTTYSYQRNNVAVYQGFGDVRSIALHEIGHALGFGHPNMGAALGLNFIPQPDGFPCGTGNPLRAEPYTGQEVMYAFIQSGEYNHVLSWDELDDYCYIYGGQAITFTETPNGGPGDIVFTTWAGPPGNWAVTDPMGVVGSVATGSIITSATIAFNKTPPYPIGCVGHLNNWDITVPSLNVHTVTIQTDGTQNTTPTAYYNNNGAGPGGAYQFGGAADPAPTASPVNANVKDNLTWKWSPPTTDIPAGTLFHPGLGLDVDDWTVVNCVCFDASLNTAVVAVTVADQFEVGNFCTSSCALDRDQGVPRQAVPSSPTEPDHDALTYLPTGKSNVVCASGFSIIASQTPQTTISDLQYADVTGMGMTIGDLNAAGLAALQANNRVTTVTNFGVHTLGSGASFVVLLDGQASCLPPAVLTNGNYLIMNQPQLLSRELFLTWKSTNNQSSVQNFTLMFEPPMMATDPTLAIQSQVLPGATNSVLLSWPAPATGFVLEQNTSLVSSNWVVVGTEPIVNPTTGMNEVSVSPATGNMFYRLANLSDQ